MGKFNSLPALSRFGSMSFLAVKILPTVSGAQAANLVTPHVGISGTSTLKYEECNEKGFSESCSFTYRENR